MLTMNPVALLDTKVYLCTEDCTADCGTCKGRPVEVLQGKVAQLQRELRRRMHTPEISWERKWLFFRTWYVTYVGQSGWGIMRSFYTARGAFRFRGLVMAGVVSDGPDG